jgi:probable F420-dependent oxidoreductase
MKVGFALPQIGPKAGPEGVRRIAEAAERAGYDSLWVLDRLMWPLRPRDKYPVTPDGSLPQDYQNVLDPIETLSFVAGFTRRVQLGTSVIVAAYQGPVLAARRFATLDVLSNGRALCGIGTGWSRDEYEASGIPFAKRDERLAECLEAMIAIWTRETVEFQGKFYRIAPSKIGPKPVQKPHPPIYLGAYAPRACRNAARYGQGWHPGGPPSWDWLAQQRDALRRMVAEAGREPEKFEIVLRAFVVLSEEARPADGWLFTGTISQIREDCRRAAELGVAHVFFDVQFAPGMTLERMPDQVVRLREAA